MVTLEFPAKEIEEDLRLYGKELEVAQKRAIRDSLRRMQTVGRKEARSLTGLRSASANRRIRAFTPQTRFWVGARPPLVTSFQTAKLKAPPRRLGRVGRAVVLDGRRVEGAFVPQSGRLAGRAFRKQESGKLEAVRLDRSEQMRQAFYFVYSRIPTIYDEQFRATVERSINDNSRGS